MYDKTQFTVMYIQGGGSKYVYLQCRWFICI